MHFIYELAHPITGIVAYVGITNDLYARFKQHLRCGEINGKKNAWIQELQDGKLIPSIRVLEVVDTSEQARDREDYWIQRYLNHGVELHNIRIDGIVLRKNPRAGRKKKDTIGTLQSVKCQIEVPKREIDILVHRNPLTKIKLLREERGLSRTQLAAKAGISNQTIVNIERYGREPSIGTIRKLAYALNIETTDLFTDDPLQADGADEERKRPRNKVAA